MYDSHNITANIAHLYNMGDNKVWNTCITITDILLN